MGMEENEVVGLPPAMMATAATGANRMEDPCRRRRRLVETMMSTDGVVQSESPGETSRPNTIVFNCVLGGGHHHDDETFPPDALHRRRRRRRLVYYHIIACIRTTILDTNNDWTTETRRTRRRSSGISTSAEGLAPGGFTTRKGICAIGHIAMGTEMGCITMGPVEYINER